MLRQYVILGRFFFTDTCPHIENVNCIRLALKTHARSNANFMPRNEIADLTWAIIMDACQFFATISHEEDVAKGPNAGGVYPKSILDPMVSLSAANQPIVMRNTPAAWKAQPRPRPGVGTAGLATPLGGGTSKGGGDTGATPGTGGTGGRGGGRGGQHGGGTATGDRKRPGQGPGNPERFVKNTKMHPILTNLMKPLHDRKVEINLGQICRDSNATFETLPHTGAVKACYRWLLGYCGTTQECTRGNVHCAGDEITDDVAKAIAGKLAPGVAKAVQRHDEAMADKKPKTET